MLTRWKLATYGVFVLVFAASIACADDVKDEEIHDVQGAAKLQVPEFPRRLIADSSKGLQLKALELVGLPPNKDSNRPAIGYRVEFVHGGGENGQGMWESPIHIFMVRIDEQTKKPEIQRCSPVLRSSFVHPAGAGGGMQLPAKCTGCWITVIIIGHDSPTEPARLLAYESQFVTIPPAEETSVLQMVSDSKDAPLSR